MEEYRIFLICPVRNASDVAKQEIGEWIDAKEKEGKIVHYPARDTCQDDSTGGFNICMTNLTAMKNAHEVAIYYEPNSAGTKFDLGALFMLKEVMGSGVKFTLVNKLDYPKGIDKDFTYVIRGMLGDW